MLRFFIPFILISSIHAEEWLRASDIEVKPIDQIDIAENGCAVVSQLNAYKLSSEPWRDITDKITADPKAGFKYLTTKFYRRFSSNAYVRKRWDEKLGMRPDDLYDGMNELHVKAKLPKMQFSSLFRRKNESQQQLLQRVHSEIKTSMKSGFPPILFMSRYAQTPFRSGGHKWSNISGHVVIISAIKPDLDPSASFFTFEYKDPWGGRTLLGEFHRAKSRFFAIDITAKNTKFSYQPTLELDAPHSVVGNHLVPDGQPSALIPAHMIYADKEPFSEN